MQVLVVPLVVPRSDVGPEMVLGFLGGTIVVIVIDYSKRKVVVVTNLI